MTEDSEGRRLLAAWLKKRGKSQEDLARLLRVTGAAVSYWVAGSKRPDAHSRRVIECVTGIECERWETTDEAFMLDVIRKQISRIINEV